MIFIPKQMLRLLRLENSYARSTSSILFSGKKITSETKESYKMFLSNSPWLIFLSFSTIWCRENGFEEGNHFYRFLEHEPFISKCFNFRGATDDSEPKSAAAVCDRLTKIMYAILESYASEDRRHVDYVAISKSEEFRRYGSKSYCLSRHQHK